MNRRIEDEIVDAGMGRAREELVCEIATVFLSADLGVRVHQGSGGGRTTADDWCRLLTGDEMAIFRACRDASWAVDWLHRRAPGFRIDPAMAQTWVVLSGTGAEMAASLSGCPRRRVRQALWTTSPCWWRRGRPGSSPARPAYFRARVAAGGDAAGREQEAGRLLAAADKADLETPGARAAIEAEVVVSGAGRGVAIDAAAFIDSVRSDAQRQLGSHVEAENRGWANHAVSGRGGMSMRLWGRRLFTSR